MSGPVTGVKCQINGLLSYANNWNMRNRTPTFSSNAMITKRSFMRLPFVYQITTRLKPLRCHLILLHLILFPRFHQLKNKSSLRSHFRNRSVWANKHLAFQSPSRVTGSATTIWRREKMNSSSLLSSVWYCLLNQASILPTSLRIVLLTQYLMMHSILMLANIFAWLTRFGKSNSPILSTNRFSSRSSVAKTY